MTTIQNFNPSDHTIQLKSKQGPKEYLPVQWRLAWFRDLCPEGIIETDMVHLDFNQEVETEVEEWSKPDNGYIKVIKKGKGVAVFKAVVHDGKGGVATGYKQENAVGFPDWIEKAETGAVGRALAALGYGTQFCGDELDEGQERLADAPVQRKKKTAVAAVDPDKAKREAELVAKAALAAKENAMRAKIVKGEAGWLEMLKSIGIETITSGKDMSAINKELKRLSEIKPPVETEAIKPVENTPTVGVEKPTETVNVVTVAAVPQVANTEKVEVTTDISNQGSLSDNQVTMGFFQRLPSRQAPPVQVVENIMSSGEDNIETPDDKSDDQKVKLSAMEKALRKAERAAMRRAKGLGVAKDGEEWQKFLGSLGIDRYAAKHIARVNTELEMLEKCRV